MSDKTERVLAAEWDIYRREPNGEIDILSMYMSKNIDKMNEEHPTIGMNYLNSIMILCPIKSREAATIAITNAAMFDTLGL